MSAKQTRGSRLALRAGVCAFVGLLSAASTARASGIERAVTGTMYRQVFSMKAGVSYLFTTRNLSAGSDTILHVLSYPDGKAIAGGDDTLVSDFPRVVDPASSVKVPAATSDRTVYLVVRGKPGTADGTGELRIVGLMNAIVVKDTTTSIQFSAGFVKNVPSLAQGTHITTVEESIGTIDSLVMVFGNGNIIEPLAFDDDDGIDLMSFARLDTPCASNCQIVVGTPTPWIRIGSILVGFPPGPVRVVWDETVESHDSDTDGLSDELEAMILTDPRSKDTDADAIDDGFEVYGGQFKSDGSPPPLGGGKEGNLFKFPKYGANPIGPDVFVEVDWVPACPASDPQCCRSGSCRPDQINVDNRKTTFDQLLQAAAAMNGVVRVHFDAGLPTLPGDINVVSGNWGGGGLIPDDDVTFTDSGNKDAFGNIIYNVKVNDSFGDGVDADCFAGMVNSRINSFHHLQIADNAAHTPILPSLASLLDATACSLVYADGMTMAHELGHQFNLRHGGFVDKDDGETNCKMNYASIMSYPNEVPGADPRNNPFAPGYSFGGFENIVLNGTRMSETDGLGTSDSGILKVFASGPMARGPWAPSSSPNAIDWNMDGRIDSGLVRAPANWGRNTCGAPYMRGGFGVSKGFGVGLPNLDVASASSALPQMFVVTNDSLAQGRFDVAACNPNSPSSCSKWEARSSYGGVAGADIRGGLAIAGPLALYNLGGNLAYHRIRAAATNAIDGPVYTGVSGIIGEPAAIEIGGKVRAYFIKSNGRLAYMEYDDPSRSWSYAHDEFWEDGTPIMSGLGIAVAHGAVRPGGAGVFAAIPNAAGVMAGKPMPIEFAQLVVVTKTVTETVPPKTPVLLGHTLPTIPGYTYTHTIQVERWQRFSGATRPGFAQFAKPGLTYAPFDLAIPDDGRFWMTFVPGTGRQPRTAQIMFTQGNDTSAAATSRKLFWKTDQATFFADADEQTRDFSRGVVLARFGQAVMAATSTSLGTNFFSAADGVFNVDLRDYPDTLLVRRNLFCSVRVGEICAKSP